MERPRRSPARPLVLLVDAEADTLAWSALALSSMGFDVIPSSDAADAIHRARTAHPDIVVADLSVPGLNGWAFIRDLKDDAQTRSILVVVLTDQAQPSIRERVAREGCDAIFMKPCLPAQLARGLRDVLNQNVITSAPQ